MQDGKLGREDELWLRSYRVALGFKIWFSSSKR
jgi:hypothetical protein